VPAPADPPHATGLTGGTSDYPSSLVGGVRLRDGSHLEVRPIRDTDGPGMTSFHESLSPRSVYRRFFFAHPRLSPGEVERFTHVDYHDRMAFVVTDEERIVGVGRYERTEASDEAEVAFVVTDAYQRRGIGASLLDRLAEVAADHGITTFVAQTLSENRDMLGVFLNSGFPVDSSSESGTVTVRFPIEPTADYVRAREARAARAAGGSSGAGPQDDPVGR